MYRIYEELINLTLNMEITIASNSMTTQLHPTLTYSRIDKLCFAFAFVLRLKPLLFFYTNHSSQTSSIDVKTLNKAHKHYKMTMEAINEDIEF
jgi:hypothetical protein